MKRFVFPLSILLVTLAAGVVASIIWLNYPASQDETIPENVPTLSYCELISNAEKYDGKVVRVKAELHWFIHGYFFDDPNCAVPKEDESEAMSYSGRTAVLLNAENAENINQRIKEAAGTAYVRKPADVVAVGRFKKIVRCSTCSDSIEDRTPYHFKVVELEYISMKP